jgi:hypothetical protein
MRLNIKKAWNVIFDILTNKIVMVLLVVQLPILYDIDPLFTMVYTNIWGIVTGVSISAHAFGYKHDL